MADANNKYQKPVCKLFTKDPLRGKNKTKHPGLANHIVTKPVDMESRTHYVVGRVPPRNIPRLSVKRCTFVPVVYSITE